jgi:hypothetical protein
MKRHDQSALLLFPTVFNMNDQRGHLRTIEYRPTSLGFHLVNRRARLFPAAFAERHACDVVMVGRRLSERARGHARPMHGRPHPGGRAGIPRTPCGVRFRRDSFPVVRAQKTCAYHRLTS